MANVVGALSDSIPKIFEQAQVSAANHQKNYVSLIKLHHEAASYTQPTDDNMDIQLIGEKAFEDLFIGMLLRVLPIKKGATVVDRVVRFVAGYIQYINEKERKKERTEDEDEEDTPVTRFLARFFRYLIKGFEAKDKTIRYRVVQIVAETVSSLTYIDEEVYDDLRSSLMERVQDKEAPVRTQAVIALSKLVGLDEDDHSRREMMDVLLDMLVYDPSAEVRRAALTNIPLTPPTIAPILTRMRDTDPSVRRMVYTPVLEQLENPRQLTLEQRELVVRAGLRDRDMSVRSSAGKLMESWLELLEGDVTKFIRLFEFNLTMEDEWFPAEHALLSLLRNRGDILDSLELGDKFMGGLSPEKAFFGRVLVEHCMEAKDEEKLGNVMPVLTAVAFEIEQRYEGLIKSLDNADEQSVFEDHEGQDIVQGTKEQDEVVFILGQLLKISINLDYADEQGRRKMFAVIRKMASQRRLPDGLVSLCLDILRMLSSSEKDLIRIVVEIIHDLRDNDDEKDDGDIRDDSLVNDVDETPMPVRTPRPPRSAEELTPEEKQRADEIDLRCLSLCIGMLERVNSSFEENSTLEGILGELILPSVKRKELNLKEKGLMSLGLCCLIARRMALNSFHIFLRQVLDSPAQLKTRILQIVFDIMMVHEADILSQHGDMVITTLLRVLETEESAEARIIICTGFSKLLLSGMVVDGKVLLALINAFLSPETTNNQGVRQCLSYFFPVYSYTSPANQRQMQKIFLPALQSFFVMHNEYEENDDMISPLLAGSMLVDWTDPSKAIQLQGQATDNCVHFDLAVEMVKILFNKEMDKDEKRILCQLLNKLYMPDEIDDDKIRTLKLLINNIRTRRPLRDATSNTALTRFDGSITKKYEAKLQNLNEEEFRQLEELKDLFAFLDDIIPDEDDPEPIRRSGRKRRSESIATATSGPDGGDYKPPIHILTEKTKKKVQAKKRRISSPDAEDSVVEITPPPSTRTQPRRTTRSKPPKIEIQLDSDSDSDSVVEIPPPFKARSRNVKYKNTRRTTIQRLDDDINDILSSDKDSIMDSDSESEPHGDEMEEDNEVNGLL